LGNGDRGRGAAHHGGVGPAPATRKVLEKTGLKLSQMDVIELNEAFAAQALAVTRELDSPMTRRTSTRTAERSPSAILWARPARDWSPQRCITAGD